MDWGGVENRIWSIKNKLIKKKHQTLLLKKKNHSNKMTSNDILLLIDDDGLAQLLSAADENKYRGPQPGIKQRIRHWNMLF